jgi:hypothetical protein
MPINAVDMLRGARRLMSGFDRIPVLSAIPGYS